MHWHSSALWAYIIDGECQVAVLDFNRLLEVTNYQPGDLWYFPEGHGHAIQALGNEPCHAILAFNDGLYGEHGTFGLTDFVSRMGPPLLVQHMSGSSMQFGKFPQGETYIMQGAVIPLDAPAAQSIQPLDARHTHRYEMLKKKPNLSSGAGQLYIASATEFPVSAAMTGMLLNLAPNATQCAHWHPNANEWHYVVTGRTRVYMFGPDKRLAVAEMGPGDCAYIPRACSHIIQNIGDAPSQIVGILDNGEYQAVALFDWMAKVPSHFLANNFGVPVADIPTFAQASHLLPAI